MIVVTATEIVNNGSALGFPVRPSDRRSMTNAREAWFNRCGVSIEKDE